MGEVCVWVYLVILGLAFVAGLLVEPIGYTGMFLVMGAFSLVACVIFAGGGRARIDRYHDLQHR